MKATLIIIFLILGIFYLGGCATSTPTINGEDVDIITTDVETKHA